MKENIRCKEITNEKPAVRITDSGEGSATYRCTYCSGRCEVWGRTRRHCLDLCPELSASPMLCSQVILPRASRILGILQKNWTRGAQDQGPPGTLKGRKRHHTEKRRMNWNSTNWNEASATLYSSISRILWPRHISQPENCKFLLWKSQITSKEKRKNLLLLVVGKIPWGNGQISTISSVVKLTSGKVLPKHKGFRIHVLLILRKSLLERQRWKQL